MDRYVIKGKGGRALIPLLKPCEVKGQQVQHVLNIYMLRITPLGAYTIEQFKTDETSPLGLAKEWVISKETSVKEKEHYHIIMFCLSMITEDMVFESMGDFMHKYFKEHKRGDANKRYNIKKIDNMEKAVAYVLKEGEYEFSDGINDEFIRYCRTKSFLKFKLEDIAKKINELKDEFKTTDMSMGEFMTKMVQIKADYRQPINMTYVYQLALSCMVNRDPSYAERIVREFNDKIERFR